MKRKRRKEKELVVVEDAEEEEEDCAAAGVDVEADTTPPVRHKRLPWSETDVSERKFEYMDHTADVQLHAWGNNLKEAFANVVLAMNGYITDLSTVGSRLEREVRAEGHDMKSLLYNFLNECLSVFCCDGIVVADVRVSHIDRKSFTIRATGKGEMFDLKKHPQGTEVKAITYSAMQIYEKEERTDIFVIVDI